MLNTETVLKLIEKGFTHDEIMAMENQNTTVEPKEEPKEEPKVEPKEEPKVEPKEEPKEEPKQEVTAKDILDAISNLGKIVQTGQAQNTQMPTLQQLTGEDVIASIIQPTGGKG